MSSQFRICLIGVLLFARATMTYSQDEESLDGQLEIAVMAAVKHVHPGVVRIETVGGLDQIAQGRQSIRASEGATTGLVISPDGYVVSSAYAFAQMPTSIIVKIQGKEPLPARIVATDHNLKLVLLKVNIDGLSVDHLKESTRVRVGQSVIAIGHTMSAEASNISVGIVSALNRIWGKAVQCDCKISAAHYGGPLVDLYGNVLGVLVPLSAKTMTVTAGSEWYDSGIGFAIPLDQVLSSFRRLRSGEDLHPGLTGLRLTSSILDPPRIIGVRANSPASRSGFLPGDEVSSVDGKRVRRLHDYMAAISNSYAGDVVNIGITRARRTNIESITLVEKLEPFSRGVLGVLPERVNDRGVEIRYVFPGQAADRVGLEPKDRIIAVNGSAVQTSDELLKRMSEFSSGESVRLGVLKDGVEQETRVRLDEDLEVIPSTAAPKPTQSAATDWTPVELDEHSNRTFYYSPLGEESNQRFGLVVYLSTPRGLEEKRLLAFWKPWCDRFGVVFLALHSNDPQRWNREQKSYVEAAISELKQRVSIDPFRVVLYGHQAGGGFGMFAGFQLRDIVRGVVLKGTAIPRWSPPNEPQYRHSFLVFKPRSDRRLRVAIERSLEGLRMRRYPIREIEYSGDLFEITESEAEIMMRWVDSLDRL